MSLKFVGASNTYLNLANPPLPTTGYPFNAGMWVNLSSNDQDYILYFGEFALQGHYLYLHNDDTLNYYAYDGADFLAATIAGFPQNTWCYILMRGISATNRRLSLLRHGGAISHAQQTTDITFTNSLDRLSIGAENDGSPNGMTGLLGEFFYTATDIQPDGAQTSDALLQKIAYNGPFSVPRIQKDIIEYRSFRGHIERNPPDRVYFKPRFGPQAWTNNNGVTNAPHVPHAVPWNSQYVGPWSDDRIVPVYVPDAVAAAGGSAQNMLLLGVG
jgi:hypothetical protein